MCSLQVGAVSTPTANVSQTLEHANDGSKLELLAALLSEEMSQSQSAGQPMALTVRIGVVGL